MAAPPVPSRRRQRVTPGLLPSGVAPGAGRQLGAALSGLEQNVQGFGNAVEQGRKKNQALQDLITARDTVTAKEMLTGGERDYLDSLNERIAGGLDMSGMDPVSGNSVIDEELAGLRESLTEASQSGAFSPEAQQQLERNIDLIVDAQESNFRAIATAEVTSQIVASVQNMSNQIEADVGAGRLDLDVAVEELGNILDASALTKKAVRSQKEARFNELIRSGVLGAANRGKFEQALEMIDSKEATTWMNGAEREGLRRAINSQRANHDSLTQAKMHQLNAEYIDTQERLIEHGGHGITEESIDADPRLEDDPAGRFDLKVAVRDKEESQLQRRIDLASLEDNPAAMSTTDRDSISRDVFDQGVQELVRIEGMSEPDAIRSMDTNFLKWFDFPSPQTMGRLSAATTNPSVENYELLPGTVSRIVEANPNFLPSTAAGREILSKSRQIRSLQKIGLSMDVIVDLEKRALTITPAQRATNMELRKGITNEDIADRMNSDLNEVFYNPFAYFRDDPPHAMVTERLTLFDQGLSLYGNVEAAHAFADSTQSTVWGVDAPDGLHGKWMRFAPETVVPHFEEAGGSWFHDAARDQLIADGHMSRFEWDNQDFAERMEFVSTVRTHEALLRGDPPEYMILLDGNPLERALTDAEKRGDVDVAPARPLVIDGKIIGERQVSKDVIMYFSAVWEDQPGFHEVQARKAETKARRLQNAKDKKVFLDDLPGQEGAFRTGLATASDRAAAGLAFEAYRGVSDYLGDVAESGILTQSTRDRITIRAARAKKRAAKEAAGGGE